MKTQSKVLNQLKILEAICSQGDTDEAIQQTLTKIINQELETAQHKNAQLIGEIQAFERQYQMSSAQFHQRFHTGELGDDLEFVEWNALYQMSNSLNQRITLLQSN